MDIWRTDVADAVLEVDGKCNVKQANLDACVLFGYPASGMKSTNLSRLFQLKSGGYDLQHNTSQLSGCACLVPCQKNGQKDTCIILSHHMFIL